MTLATEASSFFVNLRWFFFELGINNKILHLTNSCMLFLSYFAIRIVFHSYISYKVAYPVSWFLFIETSHEDMIKAGHTWPWIYVFCGLFMLFCNVISQIINFYWFSLICKQVHRNFLKATGQEMKEPDLMNTMYHKKNGPGDIELK